MEPILRFASIDSPSDGKDALDESAIWLSNELSGLPGALERVGGNGYGDTLVMRFEGTQPDLAPLLIIGHYDTVWPKGEAASRPPRVIGDRLTGPGVYDMKSGLVIALVVLRAVYQNNLRLPRPVTFILNGDEELGSPFSRSLIEEEAKNASGAIVMEPSTASDMIRLRRKGTGMFSLQVKGRASHAGANPEDGISAIRELAHQVLRLAEIEAERPGVTINVGTISGGSRRNVVAAAAEALIDLRFVDSEAGAEAAARISSLTPVLQGAELEIYGGINRPAMTASSESNALFASASRIAVELGFTLREEIGGGASDGNFTSGVGCPTLCGLGGVGGGAHALDEYILPKWLPRKAALLTMLLLQEERE